jgi:hypothetical protein
MRPAQKTTACDEAEAFLSEVAMFMAEARGLYPPNHVRHKLSYQHAREQIVQLLAKCAEKGPTKAWAGHQFTLFTGVQSQTQIRRPPATLRLSVSERCDLQRCIKEKSFVNKLRRCLVASEQDQHKRMTHGSKRELDEDSDYHKYKSRSAKKAKKLRKRGRADPDLALADEDDTDSDNDHDMDVRESTTAQSCPNIVSSGNNDQDRALQTACSTKLVKELFPETVSTAPMLTPPASASQARLSSHGQARDLPASPTPKGHSNVQGLEPPRSRPLPSLKDRDCIQSEHEEVKPGTAAHMVNSFQEREPKFDSNAIDVLNTLKKQIGSVSKESWDEYKATIIGHIDELGRGMATPRTDFDSEQQSGLALSRLEAAFKVLTRLHLKIPGDMWAEYQARLRKAFSQPSIQKMSFGRLLSRIGSIVFLHEESHVLNDQESKDFDRLRAAAKLCVWLAKATKDPEERENGELAEKWVRHRLRDINYLQELSAAEDRFSALEALEENERVAAT